jgi:hypothetical protein
MHPRAPDGGVLFRAFPDVLSAGSEAPKPAPADGVSGGWWHGDACDVVAGQR